MSCSMPQLSSKCNKKWKTLNYTQNFLLHCHLLLRPDNLLHNPHSISALKPAPKVLNLSMSETNKKKQGVILRDWLFSLKRSSNFICEQILYINILLHHTMDRNVVVLQKRYRGCHDHLVVERTPLTLQQRKSRHMKHFFPSFSLFYIIYLANQTIKYQILIINRK